MRLNEKQVESAGVKVDYFPYFRIIGKKTWLFSR
jgi:hypothetical protein